MHFRVKKPVRQPTFTQSGRNSGCQGGSVTSLFLWRLLREEEIGFHLPHWQLPLPAPPSCFPFFSLQASRFCHSPLLLPPRHRDKTQCCRTTLHNCTQAGTRSQQIHMLVTFTAAFRASYHVNWMTLCSWMQSKTHTGCVKAFNSSERQRQRKSS